MSGAPSGLAHTLTTRQLFLIAFGAAIGVGWIVVVGDWLRLAGPIGTVVGFTAGALVLSLVCLCYGEMAALFPVAGGEVAYCYETYGLRSAFGVGWFLALAYTAVTAFEAISIAWVASALFPGIEGPVLATVNGSELTIGGVLLGVSGTLLLLWINRRGVKAAARLQDWMTGVLIVASLGFIVAGIGGGSAGNLEPLFQADARGAILPGIIAIFFVTPNWLGGFAFIPQLMEERAPGSPPSRAVLAMVMQVMLAALFYSLVTVAVGLAVPRGSLEGTALPVADAFRAAFGSELLVKAVLLAGLMGLFTTWNAVFLGASRVLFALGRSHIIPKPFGQVDARSGAPTVAGLFVAGASVLGILLGRNALLPLLNVVAAVQAGAFVLVAIGVLRLRRRRPELRRPYRVPGGAPVAVLAALGSVVALYLALVEPYRAAGGRLPLEWWLFLGWGVVGVGFWAAARRIRADLSEPERRRIILGLGGEDAA